MKYEKYLTEESADQVDKKIKIKIIKSLDDFQEELIKSVKYTIYSDNDELYNLMSSITKFKILFRRVNKGAINVFS